MTSRIPEPADPFEAEGIPSTESPLPGKTITGDEQDGMAVPADRPVYSNSYGVTAAEQARGETIDAHVAAEEPDVIDRLDEPADESETADQPFATDEGGLSAEERAMHVEPEA